MKSFFSIFPTPRFLKFSYVGFDISDGSLKYAEVFDDGKGMGLGKFGEEKFEVTGGDIFENPSLLASIKKVAAEKKITHGKFVLPESVTYLFTTAIEGSTFDEIKNSIEFSLEENVPISAAEALFDFYLLPPKEGEKRQAVVSVVSEANVAKAINMFAEAGITLVSCMVESSSLSRAVVPREDKSAYLLVVLDENETVLAVSSGGFVQFSSTLNAGGSLISNALKKSLKITDAEAEEMKTKKGFLKMGQDADTYAIFANAIGVLRDEIQRILAYWQTHKDVGEKEPIKKIILSGRDALIPGLADYLEMSLEVNTTVADTWTNVSRYKGEVAPLSFEDSVRFGSVVGLSLPNL